ncbi:MAG: right-handed parallel beta-helix repeat-containing protein [Planctomycetes bacterium]|nr:right-handed parallel beta-helix repeat-containing protein [Planctomycetota bacterium]
MLKCIFSCSAMVLWVSAAMSAVHHNAGFARNRAIRNFSPSCGEVAEEESKTIAVSGFDSTGVTRAIEQSQPGDSVQLPAGSYTITEAVKPKSRTKLLGAGQEGTRLRFAGDKPVVMIDLGGCEDVEVADLTLEAEKNPNVHQGISGSGARRLRIHHVTVRNLVKSNAWGPHGILFSGNNPTRENGVTDSEISDCTFENIALDSEWGSGIRLAWGSSRNRILRNTIRGTGRGGILTDDGSTDLVIQGNTVTGSGGEGLGIEVWGGCDRSVIEDNKVDHWISIGGCDCCAVRRNVISDKSGVVKFIGIEGIGKCCVYTDNVVDDGQQLGLSVSAVNPKNYAFWGYNTVRNCIQWGAQFQGESSGIAYHYLYRCRFLGTTVGRGKPWYPGDEGNGFRTLWNVHQLTLEECEMSGNQRHGVQLVSADVDSMSFVRCKITGNAGSAVVSPDKFTAIECKDCTVEGNGNNTLPANRPFPNPPPTASFTVSHESSAGKPVSFTSTSKATTGNIAAVLWDFNDGPPSTETVTTHIYSKPGEYRVTLVVWDEFGRGARCERIVSVVK